MLLITTQTFMPEISILECPATGDQWGATPRVKGIRMPRPFIGRIVRLLYLTQFIRMSFFIALYVSLRAHAVDRISDQLLHRISMLGSALAALRTTKDQASDQHVNLKPKNSLRFKQDMAAVLSASFHKVHLISLYTSSRLRRI